MANGTPDGRGAESNEMYRWQGGVDARLDEHGRRLDVVNGDAKAARQATEKILVEVAILRTRIAVWATIGGVVGAGIVSLAISLLTKGLG